ncbi:hypothetical protein JCM3766R1_002166 [Sporobolomyces carnicolor]
MLLSASRSLSIGIIRTVALQRLQQHAAHLAPSLRLSHPLSTPLRRVTQQHRAFMSSLSADQTMRACQIQEQGDLDVIRVSDVKLPQPGRGQVLIKVEYAGVNFIDTYQRGGIYKLPMPWTLGNECAGEIVSLGEDVDPAAVGFNVGDKVAAYTPGGSFAEYTLAPTKQTVKLPEGVSTRDAATLILQGLTALTFVREAHEVKPGQWILVQAAAGGLGRLLCQLCRHLGANVIGTTSSQEKAEIAKRAGAHHVLLYGPGTDVVSRVYELTGGEGIDRGVHAVFDGVGKDTFDMDFDLLRRKGTLVTLGNASGPVPPFAPLKLGPKNLKVCRPVLNQYVYTAEEFHSYASELFEIVKQGHLELSVHGEYPLTTEGIKQSQIDITGRKTSGKLLIKVA